MIYDLAVTEVKLCDLLNIIIRKQEIPNADILLHTLYMNRLRQDRNSSLNIPFQCDLCCGLSVFFSDLRKNRVCEDAVFSFGKRLHACGAMPYSFMVSSAIVCAKNGCREMLGYRIEHGQLRIIPEEAEIVKRIFHSYVYEWKGCHTIANELNAAGYLSVRRKMWREDGVNRILHNDKYVGDLTQWKHYSTDFISKKVLPNNGDNPDAPLISLSDHHEGIISREVWDLAQKQIYERGLLSREKKSIQSIIGSVISSGAGTAVIHIILAEKPMTERERFIA